MVGLAGCSPRPNPSEGALSPLASPSARFGWRTLPPAPITGRTDYASAWTGSEMIVWGGIASGPRGTGEFDTQSDGAAFNPAADTWRVLPAGPLSPRTGASAIWMDSAVFVWGGLDGATGRALNDGAAYNPSTDSWRALPDSPIVNEGRTGQLVVAAGGQMGVVGLGPEIQAAFYDPSIDSWTDVPRPPLPGSAISTAAWTGSELVLLVFPTGEGVRALGAAYDPRTREWRRLPDSPKAAEAASPVLWTGSEVVSISPEGETLPRHLSANAAYDPVTNAWRTLRNDGECTSADARWTGTTVLSPVSMYEVTSQVCASLPNPPPRPGGGTTREGTNPTWSGDELFVWSGATGQLGTEIGADGVAFRP